MTLGLIGKFILGAMIGAVIGYCVIDFIKVLLT